MWLNYSADEVREFHPAFQECAEEALRLAGLEHELAWRHHLASTTSPLVPDFVLVRRGTNRWILAAEIKRTRAAVYSARFQVQAKGYAEANANSYEHGPCYYLVSNLEATLLFALEGARPPWECAASGGHFESGRFASTPEAAHRAQLVEHLAEIVRTTASRAPVQFDRVWPEIVRFFLASVDALNPGVVLALGEPISASWAHVREYFGVDLSKRERYLYLLQCLLAEYLRGLLARFGHPEANRVPPVSSLRPESVAQAITALRSIDFSGVFEGPANTHYNSGIPAGRLSGLREFADHITTAPRRVFDLARSRLDSAELIESLYTASFPLGDQDEFGKVQTDPELAALLAAVSIPSRDSTILDPCCGEGALLSAAYERLIELGNTYPIVLEQLKGIEADGIAVRLAILKLALKEPGTLAAAPELEVHYGDLFALPNFIANANVVLMNPPFKRYEAQDRRPVPQELRLYYENAIRNLTGEEASTVAGQANLFHHYVEFVGAALGEGAHFGVILDNRWYHSKYGTQLREFLLESFEILGLIEYPHQSLFVGWTIATSVLVLRKRAEPAPDHVVSFVRAKVDPRQLALNELSQAVLRGEGTPNECTVNRIPQEELEARGGWKSHFRAQLVHEFRDPAWPKLTTMFNAVRRGSLQKEGGGIDVFEFPFDRTNFGFRRHEGNGNAFHTARGAPLTADENNSLRDLANAVPENFRGYAIKNADEIAGYSLSVEDVTKDETIEPPLLRQNPGLYVLSARAPWSPIFDEAVDELKSEPTTKEYIAAISEFGNLDEALLPRKELWVGLREPYGGELVIPRKARTGHRVHINPFALIPEGRQIRISSNFISFSGCRSIDPGNGLSQAVAVNLITAFLLSSFGQLQFEMKGYNREGVLSLEKHHLSEICVFDPRWIPAEHRAEILDAMRALPYPIDSRILSGEQEARNRLDDLIAREICARNANLRPQELLREVHRELDEWLLARQP